MAFHPQYVIDQNQNRTAVLLSIAEWERIIEDLDELEDIRLYDQAKTSSQERLSFEQAVKELDEASKA